MIFHSQRPVITDANNLSVPQTPQSCYIQLNSTEIGSGLQIRPYRDCRFAPERFYHRLIVLACSQPTTGCECVVPKTGSGFSLRRRVAIAETDWRKLLDTLDERIVHEYLSRSDKPEDIIAALDHLRKWQSDLHDYTLARTAIEFAITALKREPIGDDADLNALVQDLAERYWMQTSKGN